MQSSNSPSLLRLRKRWAVVLSALVVGLLPAQVSALQNDKELALELMQRAVNELEGHGQAEQLKSVFLTQMAERRIDDAVTTINAMLSDPATDGALHDLTLSLYYRAKNYPVEYADIVRLVNHPLLEVTNLQRDRHMDSLYSSMIHVLVQTKYMDMAVEFANSISVTPKTLTANDEAMKTSGYYLCSSWASICDRYLKENRIAEVIKIAEAFTDPKVRRQMLQKTDGNFKRVADEAQRERLLELFNEALANNPAKQAEAQQDEIGIAIENGDFETAEFMLEQYNNFHDFHAARSAVALIDSLYDAGQVDRSTKWLKLYCNSGETSKSFDDEIAEALVRVQLPDLAAEFLGPRRKTKDLMSPMFARSHQPLVELALNSLKENDVEQAIKFVDAIQEPCWQSAAYFALFGKAQGDYAMYRDEWYEKAIQIALKSETLNHRDWRLYIILRERLPKDRSEIEKRLNHIESPQVKAQTLAWWLAKYVTNKSLPQPEIDVLIQQIAEWHPTSLQSVLSTFTEMNDVANSIKVAKLYIHSDAMSAYQFDDLFKLVFPKTSNKEVLEIIDAQTPQHRGRIMSYAIRHVPIEPTDRKKKFVAEINKRLDPENIDLRLTNYLLSTYIEWNDRDSLTKLLNMDLPRDQFVYDEGEYNAWPSLVQFFATDNGGEATIQFAKQLKPDWIRVRTYSSGISKLLSESPTDDGMKKILKRVEANPDPILRGHGLLIIAEYLVSRSEKRELKSSKPKKNEDGK